MKSSTKKILVVRTDRLGDVILTLPSLSFLRRAFPKAVIEFLCPSSVAEVIRPLLEEWKINPILDDKARTGTWKNRFATSRYDAALLLHAQRPVRLAALLARVPLRVGPFSKMSSFVLCNAGVRQNRSSAKKNEAEYNLELARHLAKKRGVVVESQLVPVVEIGTDAAASREATEILSALGFGSGEPFVVVHPGMGGSAVNASPESYTSLIRSLGKSVRTILSIGPHPMDRQIATQILALETDLPTLTGVGLSVLREVFRRAYLVVAPSTGPLHLAHYVGARTIGLFSPVRSHRHGRWAPWGGSGESLVLSPDVNCPATKECLGTSCRHFPCVDGLFQGSLHSKTASVLREAVRGLDET